MDDAQASSRPKALVVAAAAILLCLAVYGVLALLRDDDTPARSAGPTSVPASQPAPTPTTRTESPAAPTTTAPPADDLAATAPTVDADPAETDPAELDPAPSDGSSVPTSDVYNSEPCVVFRDLLGMVSDGELYAAAQTVGCI